MSQKQYETLGKSPPFKKYQCPVCGWTPSETEPDGDWVHCPNCLSSVHVDETPGNRASACHGIMDPLAVWVRKNGEWAVIHRCRICDKLSSNRVAADDNSMKLTALAMRPYASETIPTHNVRGVVKTMEVR